MTSPGSPGSVSTAATISKSNENTMFVFNSFCGKKLWEHKVFFNGLGACPWSPKFWIHKKYLKTYGFSMFVLRYRLLLWGPEWPRRSKTKKTRCFSLFFVPKSRTLNGFTYFFVPPSTTSPSSLEPRMGPKLKKRIKLHAFHYFSCKNQEHSMVLLTF